MRESETESARESTREFECVRVRQRVRVRESETESAR